MRPKEPSSLTNVHRSLTCYCKQENKQTLIRLSEFQRRGFGLVVGQLLICNHQPLVNTPLLFKDAIPLKYESE